MVSIRLEKWTAEKDSKGDFKEAQEKYNLYAEVLSNSGVRSSLNGKTDLVNTVKFRTRFRPDFKVTGNWRVVYDGNRYTVSSIVKDNAKRFFWIITATC